ncbi:MAG TPA: saccharopine dehydrogenase NADP-binding domain-containing protein [Usitatibacter sp.]|nr:saccharopine dehydrogenase NADP-binding domain-containing protein [Usitatibacter sp.]
MATPHASRWMLYGAYGTTGKLILDTALRRGHRPVIAGRDPVRLAALARQHGLEALTLRLDTPGSTGSLPGVSAVVNAAGPYFETGAPMRDLCLRARASYIDLNGEIGDFLEAMRCDVHARVTGVAIIPGAGFGVVFGEALAAHVASRMPDATWMQMSLAPANGSRSRGASRSTASVLAEGGYAISDGELRRRTMAFRTWRLAVADRAGPTMRFAAAPRAELVAAHRITGIPEIVTGVPLSLPAALLLRAGGRLVGAMLSRRDRTRQSGGDAIASGVDSDLRSRIWVEAGNRAGEKVMSVLETGEGYRLAASAALHAVEQFFAKRPVGALTPAQAFGRDFALSLPQTRIIDLPLESTHG